MLDSEQISLEQQKLLRIIREFGNYITTTQAHILDYNDPHRNGERISSAFAESAVNQLVSRRMVKQPQMHWTERGQTATFCYEALVARRYCRHSAPVQVRIAAATASSRSHSAVTNEST